MKDTDLKSALGKKSVFFIGFGLFRRLLLEIASRFLRNNIMRRRWNGHRWWDSLKTLHVFTIGLHIDVGVDAFRNVERSMDVSVGSCILLITSIFKSLHFLK